MTKTTVECPVEGCDWEGSFNYFGSHFRMKASHQSPRGDHARYVNHEQSDDSGHESHETPENDSSTEEEEKPLISDTMEREYGNGSDEVVEYEDNDSEEDEELEYRALNPDHPVEEALLKKGKTEIERAPEKPIKERDVR